jgi:myo-inositol-1(or 4)-monophosphatase
VTDWLAACRAAVEDVRRVLDELPTREAREAVVGRGFGGDDTTAIDRAAEDAIVARLDATGADFALVSEELGVRPARTAEGARSLLVLDPIDGSINAKRGIPYFSLSLAVADGPAMGDVDFGYVYDFGTAEEWYAHRGGGAFLNGRPLSEQPRLDRIEILALEATQTDLVALHAPPLVGLVRRLRIMGSLALSLCHLAAGRVDAVCSLRPARAVDIAAAQLLVRERGLAIDLPDDPPFTAAPLDVDKRSRVVAAGTTELCHELATALGSGRSGSAAPAGTTGTGGS